MAYPDLKPYTGLEINGKWVGFPPEFQTVSFWEAVEYAVRAQKGIPHQMIIEQMKETARKEFGSRSVE